MKIIHTSDLHICSPLTSRLTQRMSAIRRAELSAVFERLASEARRVDARIMIIAGDLFDSDKVTEGAIQRIRDTVEGFPEISFIYVRGNHEKDAISGVAMPKNFIRLGKDGWEYFSLGDVTIAARDTCFAGMFSDYMPKPGKNIAVLHGEISRFPSQNAICLKEADEAGVNYIALGHYHSYSSHTVSERCVAVYSGTPEGRGFDEVGKCGYVLIDTEGKLSHTFVPFAKRTLHDIRVDISGSARTSLAESKILDAVQGIKENDLVKLRLVGKRPLEIRPDTKILTDRLASRFAHLEIFDETKPEINPEEFMYDKTLKGEFIRLVLADGELSENEKYRIIDCGIQALLGEAFDE